MIRSRITSSNQISENGSFWHFLAIFRIENDPEITLTFFGHLKFTEYIYEIKVGVIKLQITTPY